MLVRDQFQNNIEPRTQGDKLMDHLHAEISKIFAQVDRAGSQSLLENGSSDNSGEFVFLCIRETDDAIALEIEFSDFTPDEVNVTIDRQSLVFHASHGDEIYPSYYLGEPAQCSFHRVIPLGFDIREDTVLKKQVTEGVLKLFIEKPPVSVTRQKASAPV